MRTSLALVAAGATLGFACTDLGQLSSGGGADDAGADASRDDASVAADAGTDAGGDAGTATVDAGPPWKLYGNTSVTPAAWSAVDLDSAWNGANAPPPRGIMAVTQLTHTNRLLVWADDGKFYTRLDGVWQPPQLTADVFPALVGHDFRGAYHQPDYPTAGVEELVLVDNPTAFLYTYSATGAVNLEVPPVTLTDEAGPYGAPKGTKKCRWVLRSWNLAASGAARLTEYSGYDADDYVYEYDGTPKPSNKWLFAMAPLFVGKTNVPPKDSIKAGWRDDALDANYLIVK